MPELDPLLAAVEALTKPQRTKHLQDVIERWATKDDEGIEHEHEKVVGQKLVTVTMASLLDQFRDATNPSTNTAVGSSSLASTRNVLDSTALYEYAKISSATGDWCRIVKAEATRDAGTNLIRWYAKWIGTNADPANSDWYLRHMRAWASLIRAHLDPPKRRDIMYPCPICGKKYWGAGDEGGMWPLEMRYRLDDDDEPVVESVICRACEPVTTWLGRESVRELFEELEERYA